MRVLKALLGTIAATIALVLGMIIGYNMDGASNTRPNYIASTESPGEVVGKASAGAAKETAKKIPIVKGDDLVHVGEDIPAGTYRVKEALTDGTSCYWMKSSDAEGRNIIANDLPSGGRPQVSLKTGQWFKSDGCPDWIKR